MTEQRAAQIRELVYDVLADADTRASLLSNGLQAGWNDQLGFFLSDSNGRFLLRIMGLMQLRYVYSYRYNPDNGRGGFENTRTKLTFRGYVYQ